MKKIYIVMTYTGTILSRLVKIYTRKEYSHVSISLDKNLNTMYSFGRYNAYNPFWGGFVRESPEFGTFKRFYNTTSKIYALKIDDKSYEKIVKIIEKFKENKDSYSFNIIGLSAVVVNMRIQRKNSFYCAEFVKYVLDNAGLDLDLPDMITPNDFEHIKNLDVVYTGKLADYRS